MEKVVYIVREMLVLIRKEKLFFLAPLMIVLAFLAFLVYHVGPAITTTFIYAGI